MVNYGRRFSVFFIIAALLASAELWGCSAGEERAAEPVPARKAMLLGVASSNGVTASGSVPSAHVAGEAHAAAAVAADPDTRAPLDARPVIACFGDSLTAGLGIEPEQSYPADLQRMLDDAGYHYRVVNEGVSGDTTKDGLERIGPVLAKRPSIVVLEFGGNDGLRGLPVRDAKENLAEMIARLQGGKAKVALAGISLPPQYGGVYITQFDAMYPALAKQYHVPLLPFILQDVWGVQGDIQPDGVHPTAQGARQVAENVERLIRPMLKK